MKLLIDLNYCQPPTHLHPEEIVNFPFAMFPSDPQDYCERCGYLLREHLWQLIDDQTVIDCAVTA